MIPEGFAVDRLARGFSRGGALTFCRSAQMRPKPVLIAQGPAKLASSPHRNNRMPDQHQGSRRQSVRLFLAALLIGLIGGGMTPTRGVAASLSDVIERVSPSVVGVGAAFPRRAPTGGKPTRRLLGTGFAIAVEGGRSFVVTNAHVIPADLDAVHRERLAIFVGRGAEASQRWATEIVSDPVHDLALLTYEGAPLPSLELDDRGAARAGDAVAFTGFPIGAALGLYPATHDGIVAAITPIARVADRAGQLSATQLRRLRDPFEVYQLDAIAYPGNSGSPVYRADSGRVIGVMNSVFVKESRENLLARPSGIAYAIPIQHLQTLIATVQNP